MSGASSRLDLLARRSLERARKLEWAMSATAFARRREGLGVDGDGDGASDGSDSAALLSEHRRTVRTLYRDGLRAGRRLPDPCARHFVHNRLGEQFRRFRNLTSENETNERLREARRWTRRLRRCSYDDGDYIAVLERAYGLRGRMKHLIRACDVECAEGAPQKKKRPARFILPAVSERTGETFTLRYLFQTLEKGVEETEIDEKEKSVLSESLDQQMRMLRLRVPRYFHPNGVVARVLGADSTEDECESGELDDENGGDGDHDDNERDDGDDLLKYVRAWPWEVTTEDDANPGPSYGAGALPSRAKWETLHLALLKTTFVPAMMEQVPQMPRRLRRVYERTFNLEKEYVHIRGDVAKATAMDVVDGEIVARTSSS
jgi:hypothetical protein